MKPQVFKVLPEDHKHVRVSYNDSISKMALNKLKKYICRVWKTQLNENKRQEKPETEEKVIALKSLENKQYNNRKFFKGNFNKCGKCDNREQYNWVNDNKGNKNKNDRKPHFNG